MGLIKETQAKLVDARDNMQSAAGYSYAAIESTRRTKRGVTRVVADAKLGTQTVGWLDDTLKTLAEARGEAESAAKDAVGKFERYLGTKEPQNERAQAVLTFGGIAVQDLAGTQEAAIVVLPKAIAENTNDAKQLGALLKRAEALAESLEGDLGLIERGLGAVAASQVGARDAAISLANEL